MQFQPRIVSAPVRQDYAYKRLDDAMKSWRKQKYWAERNRRPVPPEPTLAQFQSYRPRPQHYKPQAQHRQRNRLTTQPPLKRPRWSPQIPRRPPMPVKKRPVIIGSAVYPTSSSMPLQPPTPSRYGINWGSAIEERKKVCTQYETAQTSSAYNTHRRKFEELCITTKKISWIKRDASGKEIKYQDLQPPKRACTDELFSTALVGVWNKNKKTHSNVQTMHAMLRRAAIFNALPGLEQSHSWPETTKTMMAIQSSPQWKSYKPTSAETLDWPQFWRSSSFWLIRAWI